MWIKRSDAYFYWPLYSLLHNNSPLAKSWVDICKGTFPRMIWHQEWKRKYYCCFVAHVNHRYLHQNVGSLDGKYFIFSFKAWGVISLKASSLDRKEYFCVSSSWKHHIFQGKARGYFSISEKILCPLTFVTIQENQWPISMAATSWNFCCCLRGIWKSMIFSVGRWCYNHISTKHNYFLLK